MVVTRPLINEDYLVFDRFLAPHTPWLYFMRSNIRRGALHYYGEPYQAEYIAAFRDGALCGVLAHSWSGSIQCFLPEYEAARPLAVALAEARQKRPRPINCLLGIPDHVDLLHRYYDLQPEDFRNRGGLEELFTLDLMRLQASELLKQPHVRVRQAVLADKEQLVTWRHDFYVEAQGDLPGPETRAKARGEIGRRIDEGDLFVLEDLGEPVSFCGAGGFLTDWKIIGPVWTPPALRGKGYARTIVAGALLQLRAKGAKHAVLFSNNPQAIRAYKALGFTRQGDWRLDFFRNPPTTLPLP